jgi:hypothetical protein
MTLLVALLTTIVEIEPVDYADEETAARAAITRALELDSWFEHCGWIVTDGHVYRMTTPVTSRERRACTMRTVQAEGWRAIGLYHTHAWRGRDEPSDTDWDLVLKYGVTGWLGKRRLYLRGQELLIIRFGPTYGPLWRETLQMTPPPPPVDGTQDPGVDVGARGCGR